MTDNTPQAPKTKPVFKKVQQNLSNFADGVTPKNPLQVDVVVDDKGKVVVFHDKPFKDEIGWFECDLDESLFYFIFDEGDMIDAGITVSDKMKKYMQNSHQILTVFLDEKTGEAVAGNHYPLILQSNPTK